MLSFWWDLLIFRITSFFYFWICSLSSLRHYCLFWLSLQFFIFFFGFLSFSPLEFFLSVSLLFSYLWEKSSFSCEFLPSLPLSFIFLGCSSLSEKFCAPFEDGSPHGGLSRSRGIHVGWLVGCKIGAGAVASAAGMVSNLIGDHSSTVASAFPKSALPLMVDCLTIFLSFSFLIQATLCSILARQLPGDRSRDEGEEHDLSSEPETKPGESWSKCAKQSRDRLGWEPKMSRSWWYSSWIRGD